jgi:transcriptional regulator with XRE-family HTH domain
MQRLKAIRKEQGLTIRELSEMTGVAPSTISHIEQGKRTPRYATKLVLGQALNVSESNMDGELEEEARKGANEGMSGEHVLLMKLVPIFKGADYHLEQLGPEFSELKRLFHEMHNEFNERMVELLMEDSDRRFRYLGWELPPGAEEHDKSRA